MRLAVIIPAYNEAQTVGQVVRGIPRHLPDVEETHTFVVDDGSTDGTRHVALAAGADTVVSHGSNRGLGFAFRSGLREALLMGADVAVTLDGDGQFDPEDIPRLLEPILKGQADVVTGSRFLNAVPRMSYTKLLGNRIFTRLVSHLSGQHLTDAQCGFRAYSRRAMANLMTWGRFTYTQEALLILAEKGMRVQEIPIQVRSRQAGRSKVVRRWYLYGMKSMLIILGYLRDHRPQLFFGAMALLTTLPLFIGLLAAVLWGAATGNTPQLNLALALLLTAFGICCTMAVGALVGDIVVRSRRLHEEALSLLWDIAQRTHKPDEREAEPPGRQTSKDSREPEAPAVGRRQ
jgi:hypothetical protein